MFAQKISIQSQTSTTCMVPTLHGLHSQIGISTKPFCDTRMFILHHGNAWHIYISYFRVMTSYSLHLPIALPTKLSNQSTLTTQPYTVAMKELYNSWRSLVRILAIYVVQQVCIHMHALKTDNWNALKRIIRYIKRTASISRSYSWQYPHWSLICELDGLSGHSPVH